jgi:hypothetical protein
VQLIEESTIGVRSAVITLERRDSSVRFVLFPMVHLGVPEFFAEVHRRLAECDVVVVEGVPGRRASLLTLACSVAGRLRRDGLVDQSRGLDLGDLSDRIVRPDVNADQFARSWRSIARHLRLLAYVAVPFVGAWVALVGPKRVLAGEVTTDDALSREDIEQPESIDQIVDALTNDRDRALCAALGQLANDTGGSARAVGVCWGAVHMRAVTDFLLRQGFKPSHAEWITVYPT